jgi:hypothetical protein
LAPHEIQAARKDEVGPGASRRYNRDMLQFYCGTGPADYLVYANTGDVDDAARNIARHLESLRSAADERAPS